MLCVLCLALLWNQSVCYSVSLSVCWNVTPCKPTLCSTLTITVAAPSEMSIRVYEIARRHAPHAEIPQASPILPSLPHSALIFRHSRRSVMKRRFSSMYSKSTLVLVGGDEVWALRLSYSASRGVAPPSTSRCAQILSGRFAWDWNVCPCLESNSGSLFRSILILFCHLHVSNCLWLWRFRTKILRVFNVSTTPSQYHPAQSACSLLCEK